jgi:L-cysteine:1D-myo-inositol 2-amino-2-deoxy-alpha-D-glucopyranoside ligase
MRLYNTESAKVEPLHLESEPIGVYVCGITPYDTTHLGHAFTYIVFDVLVRSLRAAGHRVRYVQNVTDVDDDVLKRARELGTSWDRLAVEETALYQADMAALNVLPPDVFPRASESVPRIIALVARLLSQGHAYVSGGNVYFRVNSRADYGRLSRLPRDRMVELSAQRGADPDDPHKHDPLDFILWQKSAPDEPKWESPWGLGRPGWHIECSAMALQFLGDQVDIHGGGHDLVFPHHESEIAQSESATGVSPFARIWMHVGMLRHQGEKMSKSLGNLVLVHDLLGRYDADSLRVLLLEHHYRESWEYSEDLVEAAAGRVAALKQRVRSLPDGSGSGRADQVAAALADDLDTPRALSALETSVRAGGQGWRRDAELLGLRLQPEAAQAKPHPSRYPVS